MDTPEEKFEMWARVDLFGHNTRVGKLSAINTGVEVLYRLDIPNADNGSKTEFYGRGAIYSIQPVSEEAARLIAAKLGPPAPISMWDLPEQWREAIREAKAKALPAPAASSAASFDESEPDEEGYDEEDEDSEDD